MLALEHRDGTGPFVLARSPVPGYIDKHSPGFKVYIMPDDVEYASRFFPL